MNPISTFVYYNGRISNGDYGITFEGSHKGFRIRNRNISFRSLKQKITEKLELGSNHIISSITFRFLASPNPPVFTTLPICDDDDVELMISSFDQCGGIMTMMELYVETAEAASASIPVSTYPVSTYPVNTPPIFTNEASGSRQVEEIIPSASYEIVRLGADDNEFRGTKDMDADINLEDEDEEDDTSLLVGSDEDDEGDIGNNPIAAAPVNVGPNAQGTYKSIYLFKYYILKYTVVDFNIFLRYPKHDSILE